MTNNLTIKKELTPRQLRAIQALTTVGDVSKAAAITGVSRDTLYRWMRNEAFKNALTISTHEAISKISRSLVALGESAIATLQKAMDDPNVTINVSVRAADIVLSRLLHVYELAEMESRISELERKATYGSKIAY